MNQKRAFLLARAQQIVSSIDLRSYYDDHAQLNLKWTKGNLEPLVMNEGAAFTQSKTHAAPGDDDPDRDAEFCY